MKKINLKSYNIKGINEGGEETEYPFHVKDSVVNILFSEKLNLSPVELLRQNKLAEKITDSKDEVILEEEEYGRVKQAIDTLEGLKREHVEFIERIYNAEDVDVQEKKQ